MSWIITGAEKNKGLLDEFSGAAAAYSLRDLSVRRNAPVVRVRRSSDNTEQDFTATQITDGTLTTFCGAGDGFVRTWYDQSGNTNNASQTTTSLQPQIVDNGAVVITDGIPGVRFAVDNTSSDIHLSLGTFTQSQPISVFAAANRASTLDRQVLYGNNDASLQVATYQTTDVFIRAGASLSYQIAPSTGKQLHTGIFNGASSVAAFNGAATTGDAGTNSIATGSRISGFAPAVAGQYEWIGSIYELIIYPSNQSTNRAAIEANINAHYSIYP
jgi:hypothetical protein